MYYQYRGFIPQNIAPKGAKKIRVYDGDGNMVGTIPLRSLAPMVGNKLFSFGLVSDIHIAGTAQTYARPEEHFDQALTYFEEQGCLFCAHAGDMTNIGFWQSATDTEIYLTQFAEFKRICDLHPNMPVYGITGNHDSYNKVIINNLTELETYTGRGLYHTHLQGNDLFIFVGQPANSNPSINADGYTWLKNLLEANTDKRCHVFTHFFVKNDSGVVKNCYNCYFGSYEDAFKTIMAQHGKTIHYHGHSHIKFINQELEKTAIHTNRNGYHSIHIPGLVASRDVVQVDGEWDMETDYTSSQGYVVDVYADCIVYNGIEFNGNKPVPTGTFKIII